MFITVTGNYEFSKKYSLLSSHPLWVTLESNNNR